MEDKHFIKDTSIKKEVSLRFISRMIGLLLLFESLMLLVGSVVPLVYGENDLDEFWSNSFFQLVMTEGAK